MSPALERLRQLTRCVTALRVAPQPCAAPAGATELSGMPPVGFGVWKIPASEAEAAVYEAIRAGYRHLDFACDYGNEKECGQGIRRAIADGFCQRKDLWITSKLWNTYHRKEHVPMACQRTLDDLGLDYLDLYLVHFPISLRFVPFEKTYPPEWTDEPGNAGRMILDPVPYRETWEAMEALHYADKARHIGVSNLTCQSLMDVLSYCKVRPVVNQVELHPYLTQQQLVDYCKEQGVAVVALSPLGAASYVSIGLAEASESVLDDPVVRRIAEAHRCSPAQVCLRFQLQRGVSVIPKSSNPERMRQNLVVVGSLSLSDVEMQAIASLNKGRRFNDPGSFTKGWGMKHGYPIYG